MILDIPTIILLAPFLWEWLDKVATGAKQKSLQIFRLQAFSCF